MDEQFKLRAEAFEQAYQALVQQYGVELVPHVQARQLGPVIQTEAVLIAQPLQGWQAPDYRQGQAPEPPSQPAATESPNGKDLTTVKPKPLLTDEEAYRALHPGNSQ